LLLEIHHIHHSPSDLFIFPKSVLKIKFEQDIFVFSPPSNAKA